MEHPSERQITDYARRTLPPADLLAIDDHVAGCEVCRGRARTLAGLSSPQHALGSDLLPIESHLTDEQLDACVGGGMSGSARADLRRHLDACAPCAREVAELAAWARKRSRSRWLPAVAAAAVLMVLIPAVGYWRSAVRPSSSVAGLELLAAPQQQYVEAALAAGVARPPDFLADLRGRNEVLMGPSAAPTFAVIDPLATAIVTDRPTFKWQPLEGAESYEVLVADASLRPVMTSAPLSAPSWTPERPLARGQVYAWQVTARRRGERITSPVAPAPLAKFQVVDGATAATLSRVSEQRPESHLLLGILYAQAGVRDEATRHLFLVPSNDPSIAVARRTLDLLK